MANRTVSVVLQAEVGQYVSGMTKAAVATKGVGDVADTSTKKASKGFDLAGRGALLFGGAVAGALIGVVTKSMEFEKAMSAVQAATQAGASGMQDLRAAAIKAGADTQYSATEAANAITEMAKAGVSSADILNGGLNGALSLAAAGQLEVADAAGIASTAMTQFGLSGAQIPHIADLLAAGAGKAMGSVGDLGAALNQAGLLASSTGISIEETTGTLAAFASAGLIGSDAGTSFKTMLQQLQAPSQQSQALMDQLGISAYDASGKFVGLAGLAQQLKDHLGGLTQAQRDNALATIFGTDAARAATVLYREGAAGIENWTSKVNDSGYAQRQAAQLTDNLAGDLERLGGSFDTLLISIGQGLQGPLRGLVQMLGGLVNATGAVFKAFGNLPGPIQAAILAAAGWAAMGGKITGVFSAVQGKIAGFRQELELQQALFAMQSTNLSDADRALGGLGGTAERTGQKFGLARAAIGGFAKAIGPELGIAVGVAAVSTLADDFGKVMNAGHDAATEVAGLSRELDKMGSNTERIGAITSQINDLRQKLEDTRAIVDQGLQAGGGSWVEQMLGPTAVIVGQAPAIRDADAAANVYAEHIAELETKQRNTTAAADGLAASLGLTRDQVIQLADKYHIDLSGGLDSVLGRFLLMKNSEQEVDTATGNTTASMDVLQGQLQNVADAADAAKKQTDMFKLSLDILTGAHITLTEAEAAMYAALDASTGAMKGLSGSVLDATGDLNRQSDSGRQAQKVLYGIREAGELYIATLIQQGKSSAEVNAADAKLRESFIRSAMQMGISRAAAEALADQILGIPSERTTKINADTAAARANIGQVQTDINNLRGRTITVTVQGSTSTTFLGGSHVAGLGIRVAAATGGHIRGPGTPTSDSIPAWLSNGEYVMRAAAVAKYGTHMMDMLNAGKFAAGGRVGNVSPNTASVPLVLHLDYTPLVNTINGVGSALKQAAAAAAFAPGAPSSNSGNVALVQQMAAARGWTGAQWNALYTLIMHESGFRNTAQNPTSTAYGMFQFLNSTWGSYGYAKTSDPRIQTLAGFNYIASKYGSPIGAWNFWAGHHWYADGTPNVPYTGLAGLHKGEAVLTREQAEAYRAGLRSREQAGGQSNGWGGNVNVPAPIVKIFLDGREWRGMARVEAEGVLNGHVRRQEIDRRSGW